VTTTQAPPPPPLPLTDRLARRILSQMGENGKPPEVGIAHVNVANESYLEIIDDVYIKDVIGDGGSSFKLVQGTYGAGKSHFLYCVRDLAWRRGLLAAYVSVSPRECPLDKPLSVYRSVAQHLELPREVGGASGAIRGIDDIARAAAQERLEREGADEVATWIDQRLMRAPIVRHSFRQAVGQLLHAVVAGDRERQSRLSAWLRGESIPAGEAKKEGIYERPADDNGFSMLRSLVQTVAELGYAGTALLFDEAERQLSVESRKKKSTRDAMSHLRELIDLCGQSELPQAMVLYAVTPAFTEQVLPDFPAVQQRLGSPIQYMSAANTRAPLIDLEALDLDPQQLLVELGRRLIRVARVAYDWSPGPVVSENLERLAVTVVREQLEISHRRLFVKLWVRLLDELRVGAERGMTTDELQALVRGEQIGLLEDDPAGELRFFGAPVPGFERRK
jgi:hypothetical protein